MKGSSFLIITIFAAALVGCSGGSKEPAADNTPAGTYGNTTSKTNALGGNPTPAPAGAVSELKVEDVKPGTDRPAEDGDMCTVLYRGTLKDGTEFDGNMDAQTNPRTDKDPFVVVVGMGQVIKGWDQGLKGIKVGGVRKLSIPSKLAYGDQANGQIPANSDLFFTVKCLDIVHKGEEEVVDNKDIKVGSGPAVKKGDKVTIHYIGTLLNGKKFDSSRDRNTPFSFTVGAGDVVPGFDIGVTGMKKGGVRKVRIPPRAAYGASPTSGIPANSVLNFEIELLKIN